MPAYTFFWFITSFATISNIKQLSAFLCVHVMPDQISKIEHPKTCGLPLALLFMAELPILFHFTAKITSGPIRTFQTLNYNICVSDN